MSFSGAFYQSIEILLAGNCHQFGSNSLKLSTGLEFTYVDCINIFMWREYSHPIEMTISFFKKYDPLFSSRNLKALIDIYIPNIKKKKHKYKPELQASISHGKVANIQSNGRRPPSPRTGFWGGFVHSQCKLRKSLAHKLKRSMVADKAKGKTYASCYSQDNFSSLCLKHHKNYNPSFLNL